MPALWEEPFGLTLIEALFSGTPVLATRRGALPEVITAEVGALCDTLDEMIAAAETIQDRKSTRLNSSHGYISYAVFCLKKKKKSMNEYASTRQDVLIDRVT